jgi:hypothetical protein
LGGPHPCFVVLLHHVVGNFVCVVISSPPYTPLTWRAFFAEALQNSFKLIQHFWVGPPLFCGPTTPRCWKFCLCCYFLPCIYFSYMARIFPWGLTKLIHVYSSGALLGGAPLFCGPTTPRWKLYCLFFFVSSIWPPCLVMV